MKKIIIINGYPRSGKDLFAGFISQTLYSQHGIYSKIISSVEKIKEAAKLLGWNGEKTEENRKALSDLKDFSTNQWNGPLNMMLDCIKNTEDNEYLIFMVREPEEIKKIVDIFPETITVFVHREGSIRANNHADQNVENYKYDWYISNCGSREELYGKANFFIKEII